MVLVIMVCVHHTWIESPNTILFLRLSERKTFRLEYPYQFGTKKDPRTHWETPFRIKFRLNEIPLTLVEGGKTGITRYIHGKKPLKKLKTKQSKTLYRVLKCDEKRHICENMEYGLCIRERCIPVTKSQFLAEISKITFNIHLVFLREVCKTWNIFCRMNCIPVKYIGQAFSNGGPRAKSGPRWP